jgi:hypothetical protein
MNQRRSWISFVRSLGFRAMFEHAIADAFASLEAETDSRGVAPRERPGRKKSTPAKDWVEWARHRPGDSLA